MILELERDTVLWKQNEVYAFEILRNLILTQWDIQSMVEMYQIIGVDLNYEILTALAVIKKKFIAGM